MLVALWCLCWMIIGGVSVKVADWLWEYARNQEKCRHKFEEVCMREVNAVYRKCNKCGSITVSISVPSEDFKTIKELAEKHE